MSTPTIYKIADTNPKLPCWLYNPVEDKWWFYTTMRKPTRFLGQCTHWCHSDGYPIVTPGMETVIAKDLDEAMQMTAAFHGKLSPQPSVKHCDDCAPEFDCWDGESACHKQPLRAPRSRAGETVSHADNVEISQNDRENKVNTELNAAAEHLFGPENFDGVGLVQPNADVEKVAEEIVKHVNTFRPNFDGTPGKWIVEHRRCIEEVAAILRRRDAEKDAEIARLTEVATKRLISLNTTDDLLKATEQRAEKAEAELRAVAGELRGIASGVFTETVRAAREIANERDTLRALLARVSPLQLDERAEYNRRADIIEGDKHTINGLRAQLAASEQRLKEAEKDSERLDWLCRPWESQMRGKRTVSYTMENIDGSFRSAIDAARTIS